MKNDKKFQDWKEKIKKECKHGDKVRACEIAGISATTLRLALKKGSLEELQDKEFKGIRALMDILNARKNARKQALEDYAT